MPRLDQATKEQIKQLSHKELLQIVLKLTAKDKVTLDFIRVKYLDQESGEQALLEEKKEEINQLFYKSYKGFIKELQVANIITACNKSIREFTTISKNKVLEADLIIYVLDEVFSYHLFGTCFTKLDFKAAQLVKKLITIVTTKLHEDYLADYQLKINSYLNTLHATANHIDFIYELPEEI